MGEDGIFEIGLSGCVGCQDRFGNQCSIMARVDVNITKEGKAQVRVEPEDKVVRGRVICPEKRMFRLASN